MIWNLFLSLSVVSLSNFLVAEEDWTTNAIRKIDYTEFVDESEKKSSAILSRNQIYRTGPTETLEAYPAALDQRREAIIDALWNNDEEAFYLLARSPLTYEKGLVNQTFKEISRQLRKLDRRPLRTERYHPVYPSGGKTVWCRHQWMSILDNEKTGKRGNLNLLFNREDWSLSFVRIVAFENSAGYLYPPRPDIPDDILVDRPVPEEEERE